MTLFYHGSLAFFFSLAQMVGQMWANLFLPAYMSQR